MNITEFAEQIVFGTTLEEKLQRPGRLTNDSNRDSKRLSVKSIASITPGRPYGLTMSKGQGGAQPPSDDQLENEKSRGQLLHFLANHELLATELMALVLLKFPDAPSAFRRGVLVTLQEEQAHTQMYLDRMAQCGVEFGSYPVSGQFWRLIEPMQSPMDFVSRLSLTFEQANLDYSLHFATVFNRIGDTQTAKILHQIYTDEISHVQHGLHWFRQWKDPQQSDWDAYQSALDFPMSPQRGRGPRAAFNRTGRCQAGLTEDFIDAIEVYRQSRGRPPIVYWFDPAAESEFGGEESKAINKETTRLTDQLHSDLELIMIAMAKEDDIVLTKRLPSLGWRKQIVDAGWELPQFLALENRDELKQRKLGGYSPWAWTPKSHNIADSISHCVQVPPPKWEPSQAELFGKSFAAQRLKGWMQDDDMPQWFTDASCQSHIAGDRDEVYQAIDAVKRLGYDAAIIKNDLSASGRNQFRIECRMPLSARDSDRINALFGDPKTDCQQVVVVVEPELDRVVDLSFLWRLETEDMAPTFLGWTRPLITAGRRYNGTKFGNVFGDCPPSLKRFLLSDRADKIHSVAQWLEPRLIQILKQRNFAGYFGVDALVCRSRKNGSDEFEIKPLVELNPRMTMGHVALRLSKHVATGVESEFRILNASQWNAAKNALDNIEIETARDGRWKSGVIKLSEPTKHSKLFPVMLVGKAAIESVASAQRAPNPRRSVAGAE